MISRETLETMQVQLTEVSINLDDIQKHYTYELGRMSGILWVLRLANLSSEDTRIQIGHIRYTLKDMLPSIKSDKSKEALEALIAILDDLMLTIPR